MSKQHTTDHRRRAGTPPQTPVTIQDHQVNTGHRRPGDVGHRGPTLRAPQPELTRGVCDTVTLRGIDAEGRRATFVAATESGVETYYGREHLRMSGADLRRYKRNPVVLDAHNRWEAGAVVGRADVRVDGRELVAEITFAQTTRAEEVWSLVQGGFLRALSVGFIPREVQTVGERETYGTGDNKVEGPARVVKKWELFEVSVVPVPADATSVRRTIQDEHERRALAARARSWADAISPPEETRMPSDKQETGAAPQTPEQKPQAPAAPAAPETRAAPPAGPAASAALTPEETAARNRAAVIQQIRALTPKGLEATADRCILEGLGVEEARQRMLDEYTRAAAPVGTPPPVPAGGPPAGGSTAPMKVAEVGDDALVRSLCG